MGSTTGIKVGYGEKSRRGTHNKYVVEGATKEGLGFWKKMGSFLGCFCLSSKEGSSIGKSKQGCMESKQVRVNHAADDVIREVTSGSSSTKRSRSYTISCTPNTDKELIVASSLLRRFSFLDLMLATRNFKAENFHGEEGSGTVLIGWVSPHGNYATRPQMGIQVAVKSLNQNAFKDHKEWLAEISYLSELHHSNLVKLIGFCMEGNNRLLVYEHVGGGSLENHLFQTSTCLPWTIRMKIAIGVANGLAFLQEEVSRAVTFRDFNATNILLDMNYNAKLFDFEFYNDALVATQGYATPEYIMTGHITSKSIVYNFGVILLELLTGKKAIDKTIPKEDQNLVQWLHILSRDREKFLYFVDYKLQGEFSIKEARKVIKVAIRCLREDPRTRPLMSYVVCKLKSLCPRDNDDMASSSSSILSTSLQGMHGSFSHHSKFGRHRIDPLKQDYPLPLPNSSVASSSNFTT